jgi:hypothetical protein
MSAYCRQDCKTTIYFTLLYKYKFASSSKITGVVE